MICLIPTHYKVPMSENTPKNNFLFPQVENAQSSSKTDLFQLEFPLFITMRLLAKKKFWVSRGIYYIFIVSESTKMSNA